MLVFNNGFFIKEKYKLMRIRRITRVATIIDILLKWIFFDETMSFRSPCRDTISGLEYFVNSLLFFFSYLLIFCFLK